MQDPLKLGGQENLGRDLRHQVPHKTRPSPGRPWDFLSTGPLQLPRFRSDPCTSNTGGQRLRPVHVEIQADQHPARVRNDPQRDTHRGGKQRLLQWQRVSL